MFQPNRRSLYQPARIEGGAGRWRRTSTETPDQSAALVYVLLILLYVVILMSFMLAMGVVEEKSSRVMELLITAIRPIELMAGKILGIGLAADRRMGGLRPGRASVQECAR